MDIFKKGDVRWNKISLQPHEAFYGLKQEPPSALQLQVTHQLTQLPVLPGQCS